MRRWPWRHDTGRASVLAERPLGNSPQIKFSADSSARVASALIGVRSRLLERVFAARQDLNFTRGWRRPGAVEERPAKGPRESFGACRFENRQRLRSSLWHGAADSGRSRTSHSTKDSEGARGFKSPSLHQAGSLLKSAISCLAPYVSGISILRPDSN
jgi:hypothetical protein